MSASLAWRPFLPHTSARAFVVGFSPGKRSWLTAADMRVATAGAIDLPALDGRLVTDDASLDAAAADFGSIVHRRPTAVLQPGSVDDIVKLIRFARQHAINVAARGQGYSTQGQTQVEAGVVIDMTHLAKIREVRPDSALVDGGARWIDLLQQTIPLGRTPPTLTDYIEVSIGGTLSVGGIGGQTFRWGTQTDNVEELEVVTGRGDRVICSPTREAALFHACRAGLGQCGIIVGARVRLVEVPAYVRMYTAIYGDLAAFQADQERLIADGRFDYVEGFATPQDDGWAFQIEVAKYFAPGCEPDDARLLAGLAFEPGTLLTEDKSYFDFANRLAPTVAFLKQIGAWYLPHPWLDLFVPAAQGVSFIGDVLLNLTAADVGQGPVIIYPVNRRACRTPLFRLPNSQQFFMFALLRNALPPTPDRIKSLVQANRNLFDHCVAIGGKRYPIDSVPMSSRDWQQHFQPVWGRFVAAKRHFDPDNILTPGQAIFPFA